MAPPSILSWSYFYCSFDRHPHHMQQCFRETMSFADRALIDNVSSFFSADLRRLNCCSIQGWWVLLQFGYRCFLRLASADYLTTAQFVLLIDIVIGFVKQQYFANHSISCSVFKHFDWCIHECYQVRLPHQCHNFIPNQQLNYLSQTFSFTSALYHHCLYLDPESS